MALGVVTVSVVLGTRALSQTSAAGAQLALVGGSIYTGLSEQPIRDGVVRFGDLSSPERRYMHVDLRCDVCTGGHTAR
jgi:hypothetical protein